MMESLAMLIQAMGSEPALAINSRLEMKKEGGALAPSLTIEPLIEYLWLIIN
jgi:hypothetical protein